MSIYNHPNFEASSNFVKREQIMWDIFEQLLQEKGITAYQVCRDLNIAQSTISNWKNRKSFIGSELAIRIAQYLGVSVDYLLTGNERTKYYANDESTVNAQRLVSKYRTLLDSAEGNSPENIKLAEDMLKRLKGTNPDG